MFSNSEPVRYPIDNGISLRDYFAAQALPSLTTAVIPDWQLKVWFGDRGGLTREQIAARAAYEYADAMLKARSEVSK
jgi:hypothetical protein